nr:hypothetical protein [Silicimonas algicola]
MNRLDHLLTRTVVAEGLTRRTDTARDAGVRNGLSLPDCLHDLVL